MRLPLKFALLLVSSPLFAQETARRQAHATRVEEAPVIDGIVEEEIWSRAEAISGFVQAEPHEGEPATENTGVISTASRPCTSAPSADSDLPASW
jgi:hypothetical protein